MLGSMCIQLAAAIGLAFVTEVYSFSALRFVLGMVYSGTVLPAFVIGKFTFDAIWNWNLCFSSHLCQLCG